MPGLYETHPRGGGDKDPHTTIDDAPLIRCKSCKTPLRRGRDKIVRERCSTCYERFRRNEIKRGTWESPVPAKRSIAHIRRLHDGGMSYPRMAEASKLGEWYIRNLVYGKQEYVFPSTERIILAIEPERSPGRRVSALGSRRRLRGLHALGYEFGQLAGETGVGVVTVYRITNGKTEHVWRGVHDSVTEAYDRLKNEPGPSDTARRRAQKKGWVSAWAWDDWDLDDPDAQPHTEDAPVVVDEVLLLRIMSGRNFKLPSGSRMAYSRALVARGWTVADVDKVMHFSSRQLRELRQIYNSTQETE